MATRDPTRFAADAEGSRDDVRIPRAIAALWRFLEIVAESDSSNRNVLQRVALVQSELKSMD